MKVLIMRTFIIYGSVLFAIRLMGKRQLGEMQPGELVSTILISNLASISIESAEVPITASLTPLFLITALEFFSSLLCYKNQHFADFIFGRPKTVIRDGKIDQATLQELRFTASDLLEALRAKDIFDPRQVSYAIIETNGNLSAALRPELETVTQSDMKIPGNQNIATIPFVIDGDILHENMKWCGKSTDWLHKIATQHNLRISEILLLLGSDADGYYLLKKEYNTFK